MFTAGMGQVQAIALFASFLHLIRIIFLVQWTAFICMFQLIFDRNHFNYIIINNFEFKAFGYLKSNRKIMIFILFAFESTILWIKLPCETSNISLCKLSIYLSFEDHGRFSIFSPHILITKFPPHILLVMVLSLVEEKVSHMEII